MSVLEILIRFELARFSHARNYLSDAQYQDVQAALRIELEFVEKEKDADDHFSNGGPGDGL